MSPYHHYYYCWIHQGEAEIDGDIAETYSRGGRGEE